MASGLKGLFIITSSGVGGAETMLFRLISQMDRQKYSATVVALKDAGPIGERIRNLGVPLHSLNWESQRTSLAAARSLTRLARTVRPDFVQGWMYHGNMAAEIARLATNRRTPVLWNIRHSLHSREFDKRLTNVLVRSLARISSRPDRIVYNSWTSASQHERSGYDARRTVVIPNGFDCDAFRPRPECRKALRASLGLRDDVPLIGLVARVHPVKDHGNFLHAASRLVSAGSPAHFILAGKNTASREIAAQIETLGLIGQVHALGERSDIAELTAALDLATCSSRSEAFPNAIGEAMACAVPCVVTDVGDSAYLVGETGRVVPCANSGALSGAWRELLDLSPEKRRELGEAARNRILKEFCLDHVVSRYERLYQEVVQA